MQTTNHRFNTKSVHAGETKDSPTGPLVMPIYETSVFRFSNTQKLIDVISEKKDGYVYTRFNNPTIRTVERKLAALEGTDDAVLFSSGMAAITTSVLTLITTGGHIISTRDIYGGTIAFLTNILPKYGIEVSFVETTDLEEIKAAIQQNTKLIFVETPTNPTLKVADLQAIAALVKGKNIPVIVDSTFATPYNSRPVQLGADIVVHSATKYLGGHHDLTAGVVCGTARFIHELKTMRKSLGGTADPIAAWLLLRGLKTLGLRMKQHNANGMHLANFLANHPRVKHVYYPGLATHPQHALARAQMTGFGGVISFEIEGTAETAKRFAENLRLCQLAPSLGGVETLVSQPTTSSHYFVSSEERSKAAITDQLVRVALGIEDSEDIITDFEQAFNKI
ncbi:MAG: trans-sulfuration enzyme family protein [Candidatus Heimdallarchaeota archaeon]